MKKLLIVLFAIVSIFVQYSPVYAEAIPDTQINKSYVQEENILSMSVNKKTPATNFLWITNFFIMGLGQMLMGDIWRGLKFYVYIVIEFVLAIGIGVIMKLAGVNNATVSLWSGISGLLVGLSIPVFYIMSIVDAYNMSQEQSEEANILTRLSFKNGVNYQVLAF